MSFKLDEIRDPRTRKRIEDALGTNGVSTYAGPRSPVCGPMPDASRPVRPLLSTDEAKLNKTERAFLNWVRTLPHTWIGVQSITLKLADDCRYTPDVVAVWTTGTITFYEVKGFWRDDARVKIKVAARMFLWAKFIAVQRIKGEWKFEEIKP